MKPASNPTTADLQKVSRDLALLHTEHVTFKNSVALPDDKHFDLFTIKNGALQQNERWRHKRTKAVASFIRKCLVVADSHINVELLNCLKTKDLPLQEMRVLKYLKVKYYFL